MIKIIKNIIAIIYLSVIRMIFLRNSPANENNLLFLNTEQIGDLIISSAILENDNYYAKYDKVYWLIKKEYRDLFRHYSGIVNIIEFDSKKFKKSLFYNYAFIKQIIDLNITKVFNISQSRGLINEILVNLSKNSLKFTIHNDNSFLGNQFSRFWDNKYKIILYNDIKNEYSKIEKLLVNFFNINCKFENNLTIFGINSKKKTLKKSYIAISPYTTNPIKNWNIHNYLDLVKCYRDTFRIFILCSEDQKPVALSDFYTLNKDVIILSLNLSNIPKFLFNASLFIGNDSGLTHLAAKLGVRTIAIIGGGSFGRFFPIPNKDYNIEYKYKQLDCFGCKWKCIYDIPKCMDVEVNIV